MKPCVLFPLFLQMVLLAVLVKIVFYFGESILIKTDLVMVLTRVLFGYGVFVQHLEARPVVVISGGVIGGMGFGGVAIANLRESTVKTGNPKTVQTLFKDLFQGNLSINAVP